MSNFFDKKKIILEAIQKALINDWDPIGISNIPEAQDEYNFYVSKIYELLLLNKSQSEIFDYLWWLEREQMGLEGDQKKTEEFAERLLELFSKYSK